MAADAVAVAIPASAGLPAAAPAAPATDKATAPLAIAAAAIAASASLASETAPADTAPENADAGATEAADTNIKVDGKIIGQGTAGQAVGTAAADDVTTGIAQAAAAVAATVAAATAKSNVQPKSPIVAREDAATAGDKDSAAGTADSSATAAPDADAIVPAGTPPTETAGKPKAGHSTSEAVKADAPGPNVTPSVTPCHGAFSDRGYRPGAGQSFRHRRAGRRRDPAAATNRSERTRPPQASSPRPQPRAPQCR